MQFKNIPIEELKVYKTNPRINKKAIPIVKKSILEFGFRNPLIVDFDNNEIVAGHTRIASVLEIIDEKTDGFEKWQSLEILPCVDVKGLSEKQIKAFRIIDNKSAEFAEWDMELLKDELLDLSENGFDLDLTGFSQREQSKMITVHEHERVLPDPKKAKYQTKIGDVWSLGAHRLMCGDATKKQDVEKLMNGKQADMVFTDPPYGINFKSNHRKVKHDTMNNDDIILNFNYALKESVNEDSPIYIFTRWDVYKNWVEQINLTIKNLIVWNKGGNATMGDLDGNYKSCHEFIMFFTKGRPLLKNGRDNNIWDIQQVGENSLHPTMKPIELCLRAIKNHESKLILDLFGGSGSTLIACEQTKRKCFMMELDPTYCSVIIERWENLTNKKAKRL